MRAMNILRSDGFGTLRLPLVMMTSSVFYFSHLGNDEALPCRGFNPPDLMVCQKTLLSVLSYHFTKS